MDLVDLVSLIDLAGFEKIYGFDEFCHFCGKFDKFDNAIQCHGINIVEPVGYLRYMYGIVEPMP